MAKVIKSFHGVKEHRDFLVNDEYVGERVEELTEKGYLASTEVVEEETRTTTRRKRTKE